MEPYSEDLRVRIVAARQSGQSAAAVAERFGVSKRSVERYCTRFEEEGTLAAKARGGSRGSRLEGHEEALRGWVAQQPDLTLAELQERLRKRRRVRLGVSALWQALRRLGLSYKKRPCAPPSRSAPM